MSVANLSDVKNDLSRYVQRVRRGERVRILVHGVAVADLVPVQAGDDDDELSELERQGVIRRGAGQPDASLWKETGPRVPGRALTDALDDDREDRF